MEWFWHSITGNPAPRYFYYSPLFPNPITCLRDIAATGSKEFYYRFIPWKGGEWIASTYKDTVTLFSFLDITIILLPMIVAIILTLFRITFNKGFKRLADVIGVEGEGKRKIAESTWRILIYSIMWAWSAKLLFLDGEDYFFAMGKHYQWCYRGASIPIGAYCLMVLEMGFYLHAIYSTLYLDVVKKDHRVMLMHHCLAYILILSAYAIRLHIHALLIFFLMDLGDVLLDMSKLFFHCQYRKGRYCRAAAWMANVTFAAFAFEFLLFRIYWYPTKVLYSSFHTAIEMHVAPPNYFYFNTLVLAIYLQQVYWLKFIVKLVRKVLVKREEPKDTRDVKREESFTETYKAHIRSIKEE